MSVIELKAWRPDVQGRLPGLVSDAFQVFPMAPFGFRPMPQTGTVLSDAMTARCQGGATMFENDGTAHTFTGDATTLYHLEGDDDTNFDDVSGTTYATAAGDFWEFANFNGKALACSDSDSTGDPIQAYTLGSGAGVNFADLSASAPHAKHIAVVRDFVVVGNTYDAVDGTRQNRVRWCAKGDETDWTVSAATQADYEDLPEGTIVHRVIGGEYGLILTNRGIYRMSYVGSPVIFQLDLILRDVGIVGPQSAVSVSGDVYFRATDGFRVIRQGSQSERIGADKVDEWVRLSFANAGYQHGWQGVAWPSMPVISWVIPAATTAGYNPAGVSFNYQTGEWARFDFGGQPTPLTVGHWFNGDSHPVTSGSIAPAKPQVIVALGDNKLYRFESNSGPELWKITSGEFEIAPGRSARLRRATALMSDISGVDAAAAQSAPGGGASLIIYHRSGWNIDETADSGVLAEAAIDGSFPLNVAGRVFRATLADTGGSITSRIWGIEINEFPASRSTLMAIEAVPVSWADPTDWIRRLASAVNGLRDGKGANVGTFTLTANQATTVVTDVRVGTDSVVTWAPCTANASAEVGAGTIYVLAANITAGQFTVSHANNAQADRTFKYEVTG